MAYLLLTLKIWGPDLVQFLLQGRHLVERELVTKRKRLRLGKVLSSLTNESINFFFYQNVAYLIAYVTPPDHPRVCQTQGITQHLNGTHPHLQLIRHTQLALTIMNGYDNVLFKEHFCISYPDQICLGIVRFRTLYR
jgi:hypothetical protein